MTPPESVASCTAALCVKFVLLPVIRTGTPAPLNATVESAVSVNIDDRPAVTLGGLKLALTPDGSPEALSAMLDALPAVTTASWMVLPPCMIVELGATAIEKSGNGTGR